MGDRIGLIFRDVHGEECDIIIHSHWLGRDLLRMAQEFYKGIPEGIRELSCEAVTARFLIWIGMVNDTIDIDIDVQTYEDDCEDNGIWVMDMKTGMIGD